MGLLQRVCAMQVCMHWCRRLLWHHVRGVKARGGDLVVGYVVTAFEVYRDIKNVHEGKWWCEWVVGCDIVCNELLDGDCSKQCEVVCARRIWMKRIVKAWGHACV